MGGREQLDFDNEELCRMIQAETKHWDDCIKHNKPIRITHWKPTKKNGKVHYSPETVYLVSSKNKE